MSLSVAIQMDAIEQIDIKADSTFVLALEAQQRGHELYYYLPNNLSLENNNAIAKARRVTLRNIENKHYTLGEEKYIDLSKIDVILIRQDPPFNMSYITTTHILDHVKNKSLVINDPTSIRNAPEKLFVSLFKELIPPTLISADKQKIHEFRNIHKDIVIKPLYGNGGSGVFHVKPDDENFSTILEMFKENYNEPIIIQKYLPEVRKGDKRIIIIDGKVAGAINRIPPKGEARSNMHVGGRPEKTELNNNDMRICEIIGPELKKRGLMLVGIDVIGNFLTEINVTSPTGLQEINRFNNVNLEKKTWDAIEEKI